MRHACGIWEPVRLRRAIRSKTSVTTHAYTLRENRVIYPAGSIVSGSMGIGESLFSPSDRGRETTGDNGPVIIIFMGERK